MCDHLTEDTEPLLLDDENVEKSCPRCRKNDETNCHIHRELSPIFDYIEQDSPLLGFFRDGDGEGEFHCHDSLSAPEDSRALKKLLIASGFCFVFMIAELIGGYLADSLAIMTDAAHLFSDFIGFVISVLALLLSRKSATTLMTFGYHRAEVLGAFLSVLTIWFLATVFSVLALRRLYQSEYNIDANTMIVVASIGLLVNIVMGGVLHGVCHTHSHGPQNINVRAAAAHVLGDLLQSVGVLIAAVIIKIFPNAQAADPICTLIFSVIIIFTTAHVAKDSVWLLMQGSPVARDRVAAELRKISGVRHVHDLDIWSLAPGRNVATAHLAVDDNCDKDVVVQSATSSIKSLLPIYSCTIQVETYRVTGISQCRQCRLREC